MSALKFLSKKSWHTGLIKNNEKVWLREQADAEEKKRVAELQKQLEEERRVEEIQRLEIASGRLDPAEVKRRQRIEWMYEDVETAHSRIAKEKKAKEQEDALLGKKAAKLPSGSKEKDPEKLRLIDAENKLREDPLFGIEQERRRAQSSVVVDSRLARERHAKLAAKLARKAERREIRENRKRRRRERELAQQEMEALNVELERPGRYGLHVPCGGTDVRVKEQFVPKKDNAAERQSKRRCTNQPELDEHFLETNETTRDRAEKREEMERFADAIHSERRERLRSRIEHEEREEREEERYREWASRNTVASKFAYDALRSRNTSTTNGIHQRRY